VREGFHQPKDIASGSAPPPNKSVAFREACPSFFSRSLLSRLTARGQITAPRERVFDAISDPERAANWYQPLLPVPGIASCEPFASSQPEPAGAGNVRLELARPQTPRKAEHRPG
jgi:hypothetical protein